MDQNQQAVAPQPNQSPQTPAPDSGQAEPKKSSNKHVILLVILGCLGLFIVIIGILAAMILVSLNSARGKAREASIRSSVSSLQSLAAVYYDQNKTYNGLKNSPEFQNIQTAVQTNGSSLTIAETNNQFVIYALLPTSNKYFCIDATGVSVELPNTPTKATCN